MIFSIPIFPFALLKIFYPPNSADPTNIHHYGSVAVTLYSSGWVVWVPPMVTKTECPMDVTYFPYDTQTCMIYMGSWTTHGFQVDFLVWNPNATTVRMLKIYTNAFLQ